jgi:small-conductance mechanosensitive channel
MREIFQKINPFRIFSLEVRELSDDFIIYLYILFLLFLIYQITNRIVNKFSSKQDSASIYHRRRVLRYLFSVAGFLSIVPVFYARVNYLPAVLGLTAAGLVISLKDITLNFVGWLLIHGNQGFKVGDRIELLGVKGDVVNIGIMYFSLLEINPDSTSDQSTNRLVHLPNHSVVINKFHVSLHDMDYVWDELKLYVKIDAPWERIEFVCTQVLNLRFEKSHDRKILEQKNKKLSEHYMVLLGKTTPIVYTLLEEKKIIVSLRYLTRVHEKRNNRAELSRGILKELKSKRLLGHLQT